MIKTVFLFANGNTACTDENGNQVPAYQEPLFCDYLRKLRDVHGVVTDQTEVVDQLRPVPSVVADWIGKKPAAEQTSVEWLKRYVETGTWPVGRSFDQVAMDLYALVSNQLEAPATEPQPRGHDHHNPPMHGGAR